MSAPANEAITVVIPTWRRAPWLRRNLEALSRQSRLPDAVIVVGREEDVDAQEVVRSVDVGCPVRWILVDRPGHVPPIEKGLAATETPLVAFLDDDVIPEPDWLKELAAGFASADIVCVGGALEDATLTIRGGVKPDAGQIRWYGRFVGNVGALRIPEPIDVAGVHEGNSAWRTEVLRSLRFEPALQGDEAAMYGLDLSLQARARGGRIRYIPSAMVRVDEAPRDPSLVKQDRVARVRSYCHNATYISLRRLRGLQRWASVVWSLLIGERESYGLIKAVADLIRGPDRRRVASLWRASIAGRWAGYRDWRRDRAPTRRGDST